MVRAARIALPTLETMTPAQRAVHDAVVKGPRGAMIGPLRAALHNPELADRWQRLGEVLRFSTSLPRRLSELAILVVGRRWNAQLEFHVHAQVARDNGLDAAVIDAIRTSSAPTFIHGEEMLIYEFSRELVSRGQVSDAVYRDAMQRWSAVGVVELTALVGYYSMVAMTLNAHHIEPPEGVALLLDHSGELTELPPARVQQAATAGDQGAE
jgi:4-carboxymuconolactone decarboxylase